MFYANIRSGPVLGVEWYTNEATCPTFADVENGALDCQIDGQIFVAAVVLPQLLQSQLNRRHNLLQNVGEVIRAQALIH